MNPPLDHYHPAIAAGDAEAFGAFLSGAELAVRSSLRSFARTVDVEAVFQEAALRLWQVAPRLAPDGRPDMLLRCFQRIARNAAIDELRKRRELPAPDDERTPEPAVHASAPDPLLREVIRLCLERLPAQPSAAILARLHSDGADSDSALAERCRMKENTFLQNVSRARKQLLDCLDKRGVDLGFLSLGGAR